METAKVAKGIWGDKLYQQRAREALPLLVRQATVGETIFYSHLADEMKMSNARNLNYVLGCIGETLIELSEEHKITIPPIQCLAVNKKNELPGEGIGWFISRTDFKQLSKKQKKIIVDSKLAEIYSFKNWLDILDMLGLDKPTYPLIPKNTTRKKRGGEGKAHKELKEYIALNPMIIGLPPSCQKGETEFSLPSGDSIDVVFSHKKQMIAVEVKSRISDISDINRGLFQCVKYQAVSEAMLSTQGKPSNVRTILVLESEFPPELREIKHMLGVEVIHNIYN